MAIKSTIKFEDFSADIKRSLRKELIALVKQSGQATLDEAKSRVHSISGDLAASGKLSTFENDGGVGAAIIFGDKKAYYAAFVELGTPATKYSSKSRSGPRQAVVAHPYLRPPAKKQGRKFVKACKDLVE